MNGIILRMVKLWAGIFLILFLGLGWIFLQKNNPSTSLHTFSVQTTPSTSPIATKDTMLFVPYWTLGNDDIPKYPTLIYFGITLNDDGDIDIADPGYTNLQHFQSKIHQNTQTLLAVRMLSSDINEKVLQDKALQARIFAHIISFAKEQHFDGIVLDFEQNAIAFDSVVADITHFSTDFADSVKDKDLLFYQAMYGDVFYRFRPFNVNAIAKHSDGILVMAYDLHKANADPGPNFPLDSTMDYTFTLMLDDFLKQVPSQKLIIVLGMFGYDWKVNEKGLTLSQAEAVTSNEVKRFFIPSCRYKNCLVQKLHNDSATKTTYVDENANKHEVWFDDDNILQKKKELIGKKGITNIGYWAYSYF